jgi:hypothetical protein
VAGFSTAICAAEPSPPLGPRAACWSALVMAEP